MILVLSVKSQLHQENALFIFLNAERNFTKASFLNKLWANQIEKIKNDKKGRFIFPFYTMILFHSVKFQLQQENVLFEFLNTERNIINY